MGSTFRHVQSFGVLPKIARSPLLKCSLRYMQMQCQDFRKSATSEGAQAMSDASWAWIESQQSSTMPFVITLKKTITLQNSASRKAGPVIGTCSGLEGNGFILNESSPGYFSKSIRENMFQWHPCHCHSFRFLLHQALFSFWHRKLEQLIFCNSEEGLAHKSATSLRWFSRFWQYIFWYGYPGYNNLQLLSIQRRQLQVCP